MGPKPKILTQKGRHEPSELTEELEDSGRERFYSTHHIS